ncbi:YLP motif-containing protein 1 isoform X2 [Lingula anatina]|uniref:YLP motif-containing protein 1 n=1 Tax=Lingula anatina TaxID=7574 RepID=A0A1S3HKL1_LINAN|nr:YLP motif-containing protein 1 isoform X2 [Lingula anatina]|eukprot:XP_013386557.1 YLP motif-containing protein 1 isoform X2 [Lingula anatina]
MFPGWQQWGQNMTGVNPAMANVQPQMQIGSFPQQMYWGYQQPQHQQWPGTQPPMASAGGAPGLLGFGPPGQQLNIQPGQQGIPGYGGMTPAPPVEPPKEEKPPLPPEPQAPEPPPPPAPEGEENLGPKDSREAEKLTNLQQQAQQWQKQKQWEEYTQSWYSYQQQMQQYMQNHTMDDILKEEQEFNQQYKDWKQQYEDWKEQNKNHPNQEQYQQYANQWKEYEQQMEEKRQEIGQRKEYFEQHQGAQKGEPGMQPGQVPPGQGHQGQGQFNQGPPQGDGQGPPPTPNQLQNQGRFPGPGNERFMGPRPQEGRGLGPRGPRFDGPRGRGNRFGGPGNRFDGPRGRGRGQDQTRFGPPQQQGGPRFQAPQQGQQQKFPPSGQQQRFQSPNEQQNSDANFDDQMDIEDENETQNDVNQSGLGQFQHSQGPQDQHMFRGPGQQGPRGPRGPGMQGPRGPAGPRGPQQQRPRGPSQLGPRGPVQQGPRGTIKQGPRGPNQEGPRGPRDPTQQSQRGPRPRGPGQQMSTRPGAPGPRGRFEMGNKGPRFSAPGGPRFQNANQISASPAETQNTKGAAQQAPSGVVSLLDLTFDESKMKALNKKNVGSEQQNLSEGGSGQPQRSGPPGRGPGDNQQNRAPQGGQGNTQTGTVQQRPNQNQKNLNQSDSQGQNENKSEMTKSKDSTVKNGSGGANPVAATGVEVPKLSLSEEQHALIRKAAEEIQLKGLSGITTFVGGASAQDDAHSSDLADLPYAGDRNITEGGFGASYRYDDVPGRYEDERHGYLPPRDLPEDVYRRPPGRDPYEDDLYGRPRLPPPPHDPLFDDLRRDPYDRRGPLYDPLGPPRGREFDRLLPPPPTRDRLLYDEYRYRDPYRYSPLPRPPPTRGYGYLPAPPPLPPLAPRSAPEVIDYGHQGSVMKEKEKEIIDYGHGSGSGSSTAVDDYFSKELIRERDDPYYNRPLDDRLSRDIDRGRPRERSRSRERDWDRLRDRDRERDRGRERSRERDRSRERERIRDIDRGRDIDRSRDRDRYTRDRHAASLRPPRDPYPAPGERSTSYGHHSSPVPHSVRDEPKPETVNIIDILYNPGRKTRPANIVIILRGLPGSGKTYISKLIRDKETAHGGHAPRLLNLDDYFMVEVEKTEKDPETGKRVKVMEYEYEPELEESYRQSLLKSFKKTIDDGFFPFIIVDAVNDRIRYFEEFWSYAKSKGFQVYIARIEGDVATCAKRNTYNRTQKEIQKLLDRWEKTPSHFLRLDVRPLLQEGSIQEVEMEDFSEETTRSDVASQKKDEEEEEEEVSGVYMKSKWELDTSEERLDKLDGLRVGKRKREPSPQRLEDYLQLPDDYDSRTSKPGQKRVRWADIEEKRHQLRRRELGFIVGQTDWERITDDTYADRLLNQTKYI